MPESPVPLQPEDIFRIRSAGLPTIAPDGQAVLYAVSRIEEGRYCSDLYRLDATGSPYPITFDGVSFDPVWAPDARRSAWFSGRDEVYSLVLGTSARKSRILARIEGTPRRPLWSPNGQYILFELLPPSPDPEAPRPVTHLRVNLNGVGFLGDRTWQVRVVEIASGRMWSLGPQAFHHFCPAWGPDSRRIAVVTTRRQDWDLEWVWDVYVASLDGVDWTRLTLSDGVSLYPTWAPDGKRVAFLHNHANWTGSTMDYHLVEVAADGRTDPMCLSHQLDRGAAEVYEPPLIGGSGPVYLPDGEEILWLVNREGTSTLTALRRDGASRVVAKDVSWPSLDSSGTRAAVLGYRADRPPNACTLDMENGLLAVVEDLNPWLSEKALAAPRMLTTPSRDGPVETVVWTLPGRDAPSPLLLNYHGGPHGAFGLSWNLTQQILASQGYVVAAINYRGSAGYGQAFADLVHANWGPKEGEDGMAVVEALSAECLADPERVGVFGPSYGGFMTLWMLTRYPGTIKAGVGLSSLSHLATSVYGIDHWESGRTDMGGAPWEKPAYYREHSPLTRVDQVTAPLLLLHGEEDRTCLLIEAEMMFSGLRWQRKPVELVRYPGESHSFHRAGRPGTVVDVHRRMLDWFERWI